MIDVFITIDTECSEERLTAFGIRPPVGYDVMMRGRFVNQPRGLGTDLLVAELNRAELPATFFLEPLCAEHFGESGLALVVRQLLDARQDIQLHLHPNFRRPAWRATGGEPLEDNIGAYAIEDQIGLLRDGLDQLIRCGVPPGSLCGFRAGNFGAANSTWLALAAVGLSVSSNLNLAYRERSCLIEEDSPRIDLYEPVRGVWELPISCFREGSHYRPLQLTAVSSPEMRLALERMEALGTRCATIVTHAFEFFVVDDERIPSGRPNRINIRRLRSLLDYLSRERRRFEVRTIRWLGDQVENGCVSARQEPSPIPLGSRRLRLMRHAEQLAKRLEMRPRRR